MRKAPRNFRLTPEMVRKNPPLPRAYPIFRFATTLATLLLFFTMGLNFVGPQLASQPPAFGMGGGGAPDTFAAESAQAEEAPAAELPVPATEAPAEEPSILMVPQATATALAEDNARAAETASVESGVGEAEEQIPPQATAETAPPVSPVWQWILAGMALLSALVMALMRQMSVNRWRRK
jgi:hypothetical protein